MGGGGKSSTVEKNVDPWVAQQPYLNDIFGQAQKLYYKPGPFYYPGQSVPGLPGTTQAAQNYLTQAAGGAGQQVAGDAANASNFLTTQARDVNNNPALQGAIQAAQRPLIQQYGDAGGTLNQIGDQAQAYGQYGGSRQAVAEGIARGRLDQTLGDISARMTSEAYGQGLDATARGLQLTPMTQQAIAMPATLWDTVGQQQMGYEQMLINDAMNRWNFDQQSQWNKLANYQGMVSGQYGMQGDSEMSGGGTSPFMGALGGAAMGAGAFGLANSLGAFGATQAWNPYGWLAMGAGALLGAYAS